MLKRLVVLLLAVVAGIYPSQSNAQMADAIKAGVGLGGLAVGGKVISECVDHIIICTTVTIGGLAEIGYHLDKAGSDSKRSDYCAGGYADLYRVMGSLEYRQIRVTGSYQILPLAFSQKQFFFNVADAIGLAHDTASFPDVIGKTRYLVTSKACVDTIQQGVPFPDAGRQAISFSRRDLPRLNSDTSVTGGITLVQEIN